MINTDEIRAYMGRRNINNSRLCKLVGISRPTLKRIFETKKIKSGLAEKIINVLQISEQDVVKIFFG